MIHLNEDLINRLDRELGQAIRAVESGAATQATVALTFAVALDEDDRVEVRFVHKDGTSSKGRWTPGLQGRLPLDDPELQAAIREVGR